MRELRLVPCAVAVWAAALAVVLEVELLFFGCVGLVTVGLALRRLRGQAVMIAGGALVSLLVALVRKTRAAAFDFGGVVVGHVVGRPTPTRTGGWFLPVRVDGFPSQLPLFTADLPDKIKVGSTAELRVHAHESERPSLSGITLSGDIVRSREPNGAFGWAAEVADNFRVAVERWVGSGADGLIPAMVLGDTSLQTEAERQLYIDTGLSHLSAVSGANITIVTVSAAVIAGCFAAGPRGQFLSAGGALGLYVLLVGPEPSVLRAAVTGGVGLCAVVGSRRMEPMHALSLSVITLVLWRSELAAEFGFVLSVAATAGIVGLSPMLVNAIGRTKLPLLIVRALAVALAADMATLPVVALMAGEVSVVSVGANVAVAPAAAPVTLIGLIAAGCAQLPGRAAVLSAVPLKATEPFAWWIHSVARWFSSLPLEKIEAAPLVIVVAYGWIIAGFLYSRPRLTGAVSCAIIFCVAGTYGVSPGGPRSGHRQEVILTPQNTVTVEREKDAFELAPGSNLDAIVVSGKDADSPGTPHDRPSVTPEGIPVLYPETDGEVRIYSDGDQRAVSGQF